MDEELLSFTSFLRQRMNIDVDPLVCLADLILEMDRFARVDRLSADTQQHAHQQVLQTIAFLTLCNNIPSFSFSFTFPLCFDASSLENVDEQSLSIARELRRRIDDDDDQHR